MKIETKLDIDDECWFMWDNKPISKALNEIVITIIPNGVGIDSVSISYEMSHPNSNGTGIIRYNESEVFATKQDLLNSL